MVNIHNVLNLYISVYLGMAFFDIKQKTLSHQHIKIKKKSEENNSIICSIQNAHGYCGTCSNSSSIPHFPLERG